MSMFHLETVHLAGEPQFRESRALPMLAVACSMFLEAKFVNVTLGWLVSTLHHFQVKSEAKPSDDGK